MKTLDIRTLLSDNLLEVIGATILVRLAKGIPSIGPSVWVCFGLIVVVIAVVVVLDDWVAQGSKVDNLYLVGLLLVHAIAIIFGLVVGWLV